METALQLLQVQHTVCRCNTLCAKRASQINAERPLPVLSVPYTWQDFSSGLHDSSFSVRVCMPRVCDSAAVSGCRMKHMSMGSSSVTDIHSPGHQAGDSCMANTSSQASPGPHDCEQRLTQQPRV